MSLETAYVEEGVANRVGDFELPQSEGQKASLVDYIVDNYGRWKNSGVVNVIVYRGDEGEIVERCTSRPDVVRGIIVELRGVEHKKVTIPPAFQRLSMGNCYRLCNEMEEDSGRKERIILSDFRSFSIDDYCALCG